MDNKIVSEQIIKVEHNLFNTACVCSSQSDINQPQCGKLLRFSMNTMFIINI